MNAYATARRISAAPLFWPLWAITVALQVLDVASVWLGSTGQRVREVNPVLLTLEAHYGLMAATVLKGALIGCGLALMAGFYLLGRRLHSRLLAGLCLACVAVVALYSAAIFWLNVAAMLGH